MSKERKIGVEVEFSNLSLDKCSKIITELFGGEIIKNSRYDYEVKKTSLGDFKLELDAKLLKKLVLNPTYSKISKLFGQDDELSQLVDKTASFLIPYEVVAPPVTISELDKIDLLVDKLRLNGALGTTHAFQYAFGVHLNVEPLHMDIKSILKTFQAFLFIQHWLERQMEVDITRKFSPFIENFDKEFLLYITKPSYKPNKEHFIKDYIYFNPSRNRVLDMLPLLAYLDRDIVRAKLPKEKINIRPTFHFRMPNSKIDLFRWNIKSEFQLWEIVEKLSQNDRVFKELQNEFIKFKTDMFYTKDEYLQKCHECITNRLLQ